MAFDASQTNQQISDSIGSMLLLNASCQALIEVSIAPSDSPWYPVLDQELGQAQDLVVGWRQNGYRYFQDEILGQIDACAKAFLAAQPGIDALFRQLQAQFDSSMQARIAAQLDALDTPVQGMVEAINGYTSRLTDFERKLGVPYANMNTSIAQIQAQEADIQQQISTINAQIQQLQQQVQVDRDAIAKAQAQKTRGFVETVFGVLLTPFTGGVSLILAGIGVATVAQAQEKIDSLQATITQYQATITSDQQTLSSDQQQVATLNGLTMSLSMALNDINAIDTALDSLKVTWSVLAGEITGAANDVAQAHDAQQAIVAQVWFDAACNSWRAVEDFVESMQDNNAPVPNRVAIGQ
ncbi:alpha-pore-forming cytotoxin subunit MakE [Pseudomonas sp.]|uniref:alpha-pore-forming cytotoxin subunit MakE n=1 Tax=Pseudomonas sp. TaxID=306 RepID=UPI003D6FBDD3